MLDTTCDANDHASCDIVANSTTCASTFGLTGDTGHTGGITSTTDGHFATSTTTVATTSTGDTGTTSTATVAATATSATATDTCDTGTCDIGTCDTDSFSTLSVEALEDELSSLAARLAASTCRFLLAVAEYDRREAYASWECHDMAAWLSWKCGISPVTAREQVRVARCLETLHVVRARFSTGTLSYSQVRAITRVATPETEQALVDLATISTAAQLEALTRAYRRSREASKESESHRYRRRYLQMHYDDEGFLVGSFRLPPETGAVLYEAVRQLVDHERLEALCASEVNEDIDPYGAGCADALVELVSTGAAQGAGIDHESDDRRYLVTVLVDADTLAEDAGGQGDGEPGTLMQDAGGHGDGEPGSLMEGAGGQDTGGQDAEQSTGWHDDGQDADGSGAAGQGSAGQACADPTRLVRTGAGHGLEATDSEAPREPGVCQILGGPGLWSETARRVACDAAIVTVTEDQSGNLLDLGRRTRRPSRALRRALRLRDGHCQFPSCTRTRTEAHHIVHWVNGGATALSNLVSLCSHHHHRLHEGGYRVIRTPSVGICFVGPDGRVLPEIATLGPVDDRPEPDVEPYHCDWEGSPMPYGDVIEGLLQIEGLLHGQWSLRGEGSAHGDEPGLDSAESSPSGSHPALADRNCRSAVADPIST